MNTYKIFYAGREDEIMAASLYAAKVQAINLFKVPLKRQNMVSVVLVAVEDRPVEVATASL